MAIVQPFFQPDLDPSMPMFATFWNGFMQERSAMNMFLMRQFFADANPAFLDAQIEETMKSINKLDEARVELMKSEKKAAADYLIQSMKTEVLAQKANAEIKNTQMGFRKDLAVASLRTKDTNYNIERLARQRSDIRNALNPQAAETFLAMVTEKGADLGGGVASLIDREENWLPSDVQDVAMTIVDNTLGEYGLDSFSKSRRPTQKIYLAELLNYVEEYAANNKEYKTTGEGISVGDGILQNDNQKKRYNQFLNIAADDVLDIEISNDFHTRKLQWGQYSQNYTQANENDVAEGYAEISRKQHTYERLNELEQQLLAVKNPKQRLFLKAKIKDVKRDLYSGVSDPTRKKRNIDATRAFSPVLYSTLTGKKAATDPHMSDLNKRLKEQQDTLKALQMKRASYYEDAMQGPSRFFKFFEKNYLLETPFKKPTQAHVLAEKTLSAAQREMTTPTGQKSSMLKNIDLGRSYRTPSGIWVGVNKREQPFYKTGANRNAVVVSPEHEDYDYVTKVLKTLDENIKKAGLSK
jgi:hypothetical protein